MASSGAMKIAASTTFEQHVELGGHLRCVGLQRRQFPRHGSRKGNTTGCR